MRGTLSALQLSADLSIAMPSRVWYPILSVPSGTTFGSTLFFYPIGRTLSYAFGRVVFYPLCIAGWRGAVCKHQWWAAVGRLCRWISDTGAEQA